MFPPRDPIASAPLLLVPPFLPLPVTTVLRLDPVSHLPIHLKAKSAYWDPIWGWGRGARVGPQQGWKTQQQHDQKEEVESREKKGGGYPNHVKDRASNFFPIFISLLPSTTSSLFLCHSLHAVFLITFSLFFSVFPHWCSAHWGVAAIGMYSLFDPAAESKQVFKTGSQCVQPWRCLGVCVCVWCICVCVCMGGCFLKKITLHPMPYFTHLLFLSLAHPKDFQDS